MHEAMLDRHGNIICYGSLHQHHRVGVAPPPTCAGQQCWSSPRRATLCATAPASTADPTAAITAASTSTAWLGRTSSSKEPPMATTSHRARPQLPSRQVNGRSKCVAAHLLFKTHQHCLYGGTLLRIAPSRAPKPVTQRHPPPAQPRPGITSNATTPMRQRERRKKSATSYRSPLWLSLQHHIQPRGQRQSPKTPTSPEHEKLALLAWPATLFRAPTGEGAAVQPETPP
jgi:hypothetical protein